MRISFAVEEYLGAKQNSVTHDTFQWYSYHLNYFIKWCEAHGITELSEITPARVQQAVSDHPRTNGNTRKGLVQVTKTFLFWCAGDSDMGVREKTVKRIELPKVTQSDVEIFTDEQIVKLFKVCDKTKQPHRNRAVLHILLDTGIRASELCYDATRPEEETALLLENVMIGRGEESYVRVVGKGRKIRTIPFGSETRLAIQKYLHRERGSSESPYLFLAMGNTIPLSVKRLEEMLHVLGKHAGIENVHPHRFRHSFAINQLLAGTSSFVLMQLLGHSSLEATKMYTRAVTQLQARKAAVSVVDRMKKNQR